MLNNVMIKTWELIAINVFNTQIQIKFSVKWLYFLRRVSAVSSDSSQVP